MALDKKTLNDFLPNGFETQNKTDYKANFSNDKIAVGFDKDTLEVLSGPNLNNLLDKTGKNFHTLNDFLNYFNNMPIGSFPIVNTSNQLDYKSINSFFRNIGEIVPSLIPLDDGNLRLLDGSLLENNITYSRFISYMASLRSTLPNLFTTEANWQAQVQQYGECGKFVYNTTNKSLRLPKIVTYLRGTNDSSVLGDLVEAGIPQHTHGGTTGNTAHTHTGTTNVTGAHYHGSMGENSRSGSLYGFYNGNNNHIGSNGDIDNDNTIWKTSTEGNHSHSVTIPSSGAHNHTFTTGNANNNIYKSGINTVQTQAIRVFYYIVVSIDEAEKQVLSAVYNYKGSVDTYEELPTDAAIGEVYNVIGEDPEGYSGANFAWTGEVWDRLGGTVNLSGYLTKVEGANTYATKASLESNVDDLQEQINTNASNIANIASQEVIAQGIKKIEALKFASTIGHGISSDTDLYNVIKKYAHSSFDLSKFTVVGNPTITSDGVASGFSNSSYVTTGDFKISNLLNHSWSVKSGVLSGVTSSADGDKPIHIARAGFGSDGTVSFNGITKRIIYAINTPSNVDPETRANNRIAISKTLDVLPAKIQFRFDFDYSTGTYTGYYNVFDGNGWQLAGSATPTTTEKQLYDIVYDNNRSILIDKRDNANANTTSIDLKQFSTEVDGIPVFSGNKTGVDTIKPDDYEVVGSPTISADGILRNTNNANFVRTPSITITNSNDVKIYARVYTAGLSSNNFLFTMNNGSYTLYPAINFNNNSDASRKITLFYGIQESNTIALSFANVPFPPIVDVLVHFNKGTVYLKAKTPLETEYSQSVSAVLPDNYSMEYPILLGVTTINNDYRFKGSIDLNSFKIYVDGNLIYQPCLKIPYTLSNTNLKITHEMNRAIDMAEQCGYSQYFGLNESDMTCLVPQGDNITGRRDLVHREEDSTTHYVTEKYSDLYCKQMASCTANTAVAFAQPYKDEYYKLSVPYSAKSRTGFTPTVSGDWTAEGYTYLT